MPLAPVMLAVYPVLVEFSRNAAWLPPDALIRPFFLVLLLSAALTLALTAWLQDRDLAAFYGTALVGLGWWWRLLLEPFERLGVPGGLGVALSPALVVLLLGLARRRLLAETPARRAEGHRILGLFLGALLVLAVGELAWCLGGARAPELATPSAALEGLPRAEARPNLYYLVLDAYVRDDFLRHRYGFDNEPFLRALEERGFYIAREARSNFAWTLLSVTATLNLSLLDGPGEPTPLGLARRARDPLLVRFLREQGYRTRGSSGGNWVFDRMQLDAFRGSHWQEYERMLLRMSAIGTLLPQAADAAARYQLRSNLDSIGPPPPGASPSFQFVHVMAPHPPFVVDADGAPLSSLPYLGFHVMTGAAADRIMGEGWYRQSYLGQVRYLNRRLLERIDAILAEDPEAVFVIGGDHGSRSYTDVRGPADQLREIFSIFSAYRFPPGLRDRLYPGVTPVNGMRLLVDGLFGSQLGPLPDVSLVTPRNRPAERRQVAPFPRLEGPR